MISRSLVKQLPVLLDELDRDGFQVTIQTRLAVHDLLLRLAVDDCNGVDTERLGRMIGPLVCTSPDEQAVFAEKFVEWVKASLSNPTSDTTPIPAAPRPQSHRRAAGSSQAPALLPSLAVAGLLLVAALVGLVYRAGYMTPADQIADATSTDPVWNSHDILPADSMGPVGDLDALIEPETEDAGQLGLPTATDWRRVRQALSITIALAVVGVLLICGWWAFAARWRSQYLVKRTVSDEPEFDRLALRLRGPASGEAPLLVRTAHRFRQHLTRISQRLNVERTASKTAAKGGLFSPVLAEQRVTPCYLALINSDGKQDQLAAYYEALIARLEHEGVAISKYYFRRDPRICRAKGGPACRLAELAASHESDRLLVFGDPEVFLNPLSFEVAAWVELFDAWPERALLVSSEDNEWGAVESKLSEHFRIATASAQGLATLVDQFQPDPLNANFEGGDRYPPSLKINEARWTAREAPAASVVDQLLCELREFLGEEGIRWLGACAVYPTLHYELTAWTGATLADELESGVVHQHDLMRLSRLPWFRQGNLPDWLRARLIADMSDDEEAAIRKRLDLLFQSALLASEHDATLPIARSQLSQQERSRRSKRILRDHTFVSFASNPLSVRLPRAVGSLLPTNSRWRPSRTVTAAALAMATFGIAFSLFVKEPPLQSTDLLVENEAAAELPESAESELPSTGLLDHAAEEIPESTESALSADAETAPVASKKRESRSPSSSPWHADYQSATDDAVKAYFDGSLKDDDGSPSSLAGSSDERFDEPQTAQTTEQEFGLADVKEEPAQRWPEKGEPTYEVSANEPVQEQRVADDAFPEQRTLEQREAGMPGLEYAQEQYMVEQHQAVDFPPPAGMDSYERPPQAVADKMPRSEPVTTQQTPVQQPPAHRPSVPVIEPPFELRLPEKPASDEPARQVPSALEDDSDIQRLIDVAENDPRNAEVNYTLANAYHVKASRTHSPESFRKAEEFYHRCLDLDNNHRMAHRGLASLLVETQRSRHAVDLLTRWAREKQPRSVLPRLELARVFELTGDRRAAQQELEDAQGIDPRNTQVKEALRLMRLTGRTGMLDDVKPVAAGEGWPARRK